MGSKPPEGTAAGCNAARPTQRRSAEASTRPTRQVQLRSGPRSPAAAANTRRRVITCDSPRWHSHAIKRIIRGADCLHADLHVSLRVLRCISAKPVLLFEVRPRPIPMPKDITLPCQAGGCASSRSSRAARTASYARCHVLPLLACYRHSSCAVRLAIVRRACDAPIGRPLLSHDLRVAERLRGSSGRRSPSYDKAEPSGLQAALVLRRPKTRCQNRMPLPQQDARGHAERRRAESKWQRRRGGGS